MVTGSSVIEVWSEIVLLGVARACAISSGAYAAAGAERSSVAFHGACGWHSEIRWLQPPNGQYYVPSIEREVAIHPAHSAGLLFKRPCL